MLVLKRMAWPAAILAVSALGLVVVAPYSDGPIGPIPGGALRGPLETREQPDWSAVEETIELQIRPDHPWSLRTYAIPLDGELYVPSFVAPRRRWVPVALADPRVLVRHQGRLYPRLLRRVDDLTVRAALIGRMAELHGYAADGIIAAPDTWYFHLAAPAPLEEAHG